MPCLTRPTEWGSSECASEEEFRAAEPHFGALMITIETKVNLNDPSDPIQTRYDTHNLLPNRANYFELSLSSFTLQDDKLGFITTNDHTTDYLRMQKAKVFDYERVTRPI